MRGHKKHYDLRKTSHEFLQDLIFEEPFVSVSVPNYVTTSDHY